MSDNKRFSVILADPPWPYKKYSGNNGHGKANDHYSTMTLNQLKAMRPTIDRLAAENCALFMWATPPTLGDHAFPLLDAWGFDYKTFGLTWVKMCADGKTPATGMGSYTRANAEPCLLATRGKMARMGQGMPAVQQIIIAPRRRHSAKPVEQYSRIEQLYPRAEFPNKIELFARPDADADPYRVGWDLRGNEIPEAEG